MNRNDAIHLDVKEEDTVAAGAATAATGEAAVVAVAVVTVAEEAAVATEADAKATLVQQTLSPFWQTLKAFCPFLTFLATGSYVEPEPVLMRSTL